MLYLSCARPCFVVREFIQSQSLRSRSLWHSPSAFSIKDVNGAFPNTYVSGDVESGWYEWWEERGYHQSKIVASTSAAEESTKKTFSIVFPPPNITGDLHLGHALTATIQDTLVRWHRAKGFRTLWIPGYDHSGIATQVVIEKKIQAQSGRHRSSVQESEFLSEARSWKAEKVTTIRKQLKCLGPLLNWSRECYTLDENFSTAVTEAFVRLFDMGLISRRQGLVNWCCHLQSAISDIEVNNVAVNGGSTITIPGISEPLEVGRLAIFSYLLENSTESEKIAVATSRLETMLGDTAIAVHPEDDRYAKFVGRHVLHPFNRRRLPVIADSRVSRQFGTGAVKITPAHDHFDFEIAETHGLPSYNIFDKAGDIVPEIVEFAGMNRFAARKEVQRQLYDLGLFNEIRNHDMSIPVCSRSGDIIEPLLRHQWYLDCDVMFSELTEDMKNGRFDIQPDASKKILLEWLSHKRKWCISRQMWWGHQIPAYRIVDSANDSSDSVSNGISNRWFVGRTPEEAASRASKELGTTVLPDKLTREKDVLDTWFSSSLFPFVAFGWPNMDESISGSFYPLSLMETGHDIIFFWVGRMAILGKKLTGRLPFSNVLVHGMICDSHGRKMSKSLGNVIDPFDVVHGRSLNELHLRAQQFFRDGYINQNELTVSMKGLSKNFPDGIPKCGADALRFALLSQNIKSQQINIDVSYVHNCSKFCNKIWQACKFYLKVVSDTGIQAKPLLEVAESLSLFDRWILSNLSALVTECDSNLRSHQFHMVTGALRGFWYSNLCDVYLEGVKPVLNSVDNSTCEKEAVVSTLLACIRTATIALAPIMPFLAEELYHRLKLYDENAVNADSSIICEPYPDPNQWLQWRNSELELDFQNVVLATSELRKIRIAFDITKTRPEVRISVIDPRAHKSFEQFRTQLEALSRCKLLSVTEEHESFPVSVTRIISNTTTLSVNVQGMMKPEDIALKMNQRLQKLNKELTKHRKDMLSPRYLKNSTPESSAKDVNRANILEEDIRTLEISIAEVSALCDPISSTK